MLVHMFMVHLMCPANCPYIDIIRAGEPFKTLVYDYIMYKEIGESIGHDAESNSLNPIDFVDRTKEYAQETWDRKYYKEHIVLFEKARLRLMMIFMQRP